MPAPQRQLRLFTVKEANARLPLVRAITADLVRLAREIAERRDRLAGLLNGRRATEGDPYTEELVQVARSLEQGASQIGEYLSELHELGVEPKGVSDGLVDFPCLFEGRVIYLCWKLGEPEIQFWHDVDAGYAGRQPLPPELQADMARQPSGEPLLR